MKYAEENNMYIKLWATDIFGADIKRLIKFYEKMGFKIIDRDNNMVLFPKNKSNKFSLFKIFNYICKKIKE